MSMWCLYIPTCDLTFPMLHAISRSLILTFIFIYTRPNAIKDLKFHAIQQADSVKPETINRKVKRSETSTKKEGEGEAW